MNSPDDMSTRILRSFQNISDGTDYDFEIASYLGQYPWSGAFGWDVLLKSKRVLIISEAGTGKTYECRAEQTTLWKAGEAAFYFDLAQLSHSNLRDLMLDKEEERFDAWLRSQSDVATIFLDSIDELKLTLGSFEIALKRLSKALAGQLSRVRIVITTRPIPVDLSLIEQILPVPEKGEPAASAEAFADIAMNLQRGEKNTDATDTAPVWRNVALLPLSDIQIREMAALQGVTDADALLENIRKRNAEDFARRPQDLIELCADWRDYHRIRTHREQVEHNITIKLKPRTDPGEKAQLSEQKALEGASRLAIAALLTRKLTIRHSVEADVGGEPGTALDAAAILRDWSPDECQTLLERALFGFASYGRVRFHHRSVIEYLAAQRLKTMLDHGMPMKAVKRLLFAETPQAIKVIRPSLRPVAAWLALSHYNIFSEIRDREPNVLLEYADPESLTIQQRIDALRAYVDCYGQGAWRGLHVPRMQAHRFASNELAAVVKHLWESGIENPEVRELLLELVSAAPIRECADIAYSVVMRGDADIGERVDALYALVSLSDHRLEELTHSLETNSGIWPKRILRASILSLFPKHISVARLCRILSRITESEDNYSDLSWQFSQLITEADIKFDYLDTLRTGLTNLITEGVEWSDNWPHLASPRQYLVIPLDAVCLRQLSEHNTSASIINSIVIAIRFAKDRYGHEEDTKLRAVLTESPTSVREAVFWADDAYIQRHHFREDSWMRLAEINQNGAIILNHDQDASWILANLSDTKQQPDKRKLMLEVAIRVLWDRKGEWLDYVLSLKKLVADSPSLTTYINDILKPVPVNHELIRMEKEHQRNRKQAESRRAKDHESWTLFWKEVATNPNTAFSHDQEGNTAWNLWKAMSRSGDQSRATGWNRRFIEQHFSKEIADRLRSTMMDIWRNDIPTLRSERPDTEKGTFLIRWQLGLAAIAAEAEDPNWAQNLSVQEAELAARYAPIELNGFPSWLESLTVSHPAAIEGVLGSELISELNEIATNSSHSIVLQNVSHAAPSIAILFLPRLRTWCDENVHRIREDEDITVVTERLKRVVDILLSYGDSLTHKHICKVAADQLTHRLEPAFEFVWLPVLMRLDPVTGIDWLEQCLIKIEPGQQGPGVGWISQLFGDRISQARVDLHLPEFTPDLLLRLVRLAYRHVRPSDDIVHKSGISYSPGVRDSAEHGRNTLVSALLDTKGHEGWAAKLEMANDPLLEHYRDRALMIAREKAAENSDELLFSEPEVIAFDNNKEAPPTTRDEMFALMIDRLDDLDDLLLRDDSPRAAWASISNEKVMRREIARELRNTSNQAYIVDQEAVTADEKETDIRLHAATSDQQAVIELKLGDGRSGTDLCSAIKEQLVTKYMAADNCRSGCLLVTVTKDRKWHHSITNESIDAAGLETMLQEVATKIVNEMGQSLSLTARVLDLRPRLLTEKVSVKVKTPN